MVAASVRRSLDAFDDRREYRVGDVRYEHPERERPAEPKTPRERRGPVTETRGGRDDALTCLRQQAQLGPAVQNARDRRRVHIRGARDIDDRDSPGRQNRSPPAEIDCFLVIRPVHPSRMSTGRCFTVARAPSPAGRAMPPRCARSSGGPTAPRRAPAHPCRARASASGGGPRRRRRRSRRYRMRERAGRSPDCRTRSRMCV